MGTHSPIKLMQTLQAILNVNKEENIEDIKEQISKKDALGFCDKFLLNATPANIKLVITLLHNYLSAYLKEEEKILLDLPYIKDYLANNDITLSKIIIANSKEYAYYSILFYILSMIWQVNIVFKLENTGNSASLYEYNYCNEPYSLFCIISPNTKKLLLTSDELVFIKVLKTTIDISESNDIMPYAPLKDTDLFSSTTSISQSTFKANKKI